MTKKCQAVFICQAQSQKLSLWNVDLYIKLNWNPPGEYILQAGEESSGNELDNLLLEEALQLVGINDLNVSIERKPAACNFSPIVQFLVC